MDTVRDIERLYAVAEKALTTLGVRPGERCLDFGCGHGNYTIPLARLVGPEGEVLALDQDTEALQRLGERVRRAGIENVRVLSPLAKTTLPIEDESIHKVLLYDVLHDHYFSAKQRAALMEEAARVTRPGGRLSVFPNHMTGRQIKRDVVAPAGRLGFAAMEAYVGPLVHDDGIMDGRVLIFEKAG
ncbi:MAG: class I SAM-dependent methyltransferase [Phycisphaerae bacterium]